MCRFLFATLVALLIPGTSWSQSDASRPLRVALLLPGPITDGTFCSAAHKGIKAVEQKYPQVKVTIQENIAFAQTEEAMRAHARDGFDVVIGHGFQFAEPGMKLHKDFPRTKFIINTAKVAGAPNLSSFDNRWGDAGYYAGFIAAMMTKSGVIGHIGGVPVPVIQEFNEGFERGAKRFNPNIRMLSAYVGSFSDIAKAKEVTLSLIERGADVVTATGNENVVGTLQAAREKKALMIGTAFDSTAIAPDTIVTTALVNFDVNIEMAVSKILDGSLESRNYLLGLNENGIGISGYGKFENAISPENKLKIQSLLDDIKAGRVADLPAIR